MGFNSGFKGLKGYCDMEGDVKKKDIAKDKRQERRNQRTLVGGCWKNAGRTNGKAESACWPGSEGIYMTYCRAGVCCGSAAMVTRQCTRRSCEGDELTALSKELKNTGIITADILTLRQLMSYIYEAPILDVSRSHTTTQHSR